MGLPLNFFAKLFGKLDIQKKSDSESITVAFSVLGHKIDKAQDALDAQIWQDVQKYMPRDTGTFISETNKLNANTRGEVYIYPPDSPQGHYLHEGILYVDPVYNIGAFYSPDYGFWSRAGVEKIPSDRKLEYSNPNATAHWEQTAIQNHSREWLQVCKRAIK